MKKATLYGIITTTFFYACIGFIGYAAFGNAAPGNLISGCASGIKARSSLQPKNTS